MLSPVAQQALRQIEIEGATYASAAAQLGTQAEDLALLVYQCRTRLYHEVQGLLRDVEGRDHDAASQCGPAPGPGPS